MLLLFAFLTFNFEIIIDSCVVVRNNTEIPYTLYLVSPNGNILHNIAQYHNQEIDIDKSTPYSDFSSFTCTHLCVCLVLSEESLSEKKRKKKGKKKKKDPSYFPFIASPLPILTSGNY